LLYYCTSTKVQILTPEELLEGKLMKLDAQFTCFTNTKVQVLTPEALLGAFAAIRLY
jgi:hypothetical protein